MASAARRRELPKVEGVRVEHGVGPAREETSAEIGPTPSTPSAAVAAVTAPMDPDTVPDPYESSASGDLTAKEAADLATCEAALNGLRLAFWAAGKALEVIREGRLYRATHPTFEAYAQDRWEMTRVQADRLIRAWPIAERLKPIGFNALTESQIRELTPLADRHGVDAAVTVYQTIAETDGARVTAAVLKGAVSVLPPERFDPAEAVDQIRAYLAGELDQAEPGPTDPTERLRAMVARTVSTQTFRVYARTHPDQARRVVAELRSLLDEIEAETQDQA